MPKVHDKIDFDDFEDFLEHCREEPSQYARDAWLAALHDGELHSVNGSYSFTRTASYDEALNLATDGWTEGRAQMVDKLEALNPYVTAALRTPGEGRSVAGFYPDVPLYCAGDPAYMVCPDEDTPARQRVVRFLVNISTHGGTDADYIMNRGAAIAAVVDYFENAGQRVEVELCMVAEKNEALAEYYIPVKRAQDHMEADRFAFVIGHPSMLRRFIFRMMEHNPLLAAPFGTGYGYPKDATPDPDQVYFPQGAARGFETPEKALKTVLKRVIESLEPHQRAAVSADWQEVLTDSRVF